MVRPTSLGRPLAIRQGQFGFEEVPTGDVETPTPIDLLDDQETDASVETPHTAVSPVPVLLEEATALVPHVGTATWSAVPTAGRLLLFVAYQRDGGGAASVLTAGWTVLEDNPGGGPFDDSVAVFGKISDGTESSIHVDLGGGSAGSAWQLIEIPNAALPVADTNTNTGTTTTAMTAGSVTLVGAGVIVGAFSHESGSHMFTQSGSWTILDDTENVGTHPTGVFVYQVLTATSGNPAVTASGASDFRGIALAFDSVVGIDWENAPEVQDADDATYKQVDVDDLGYIVRCALELDYRIGRSELLIGYSASGSKTLDLYGATLADFSDEVLLDSVTFTGTGSYTGDAVTFLPDGTLGLTYYRIAGDPGCRIYTWQMFAFEEVGAGAVEAELDAHLVDTTDAHDASAISFVPTGTIAATNVQDAIAEVALEAGGSVAAAEDGSTVVASASVLDFRHGLDVTDPGGGPARIAVDETELVIESLSSTDITTGNASTSKHGLLRKLDNVPAHFLRGDGAWAATYDRELVTVAATGSTETIDVSVARTYDLTLTANCTFTLIGASTAEAWFATLILRQDGVGSRLATWPGSVTWLGGSAPTLQTAPNAVDVVTLFTLDGGTVWFGATADSSVSSHISDTVDAHDASAISIDDTGSYYSGSTVEAALAEIGAGGIGGGGSGGEDTALVKDTAAGTTQTVDCSLSRMHDLTLTANCTITLTGPVAGEHHYVRIILRQDGTGSWTVTWPASVHWPSGVAPTLATGTYDADIIHLMTTDGGIEWFGHLEAAAYPLSAPVVPGTGGTFPLLPFNLNL